MTAPKESKRERFFMSLPLIIDLVITSMGIRPGRATRLEALIGALAQ